MGIPVIATNLGGMAEMVEHEKNGLVFDLNSAASLRQQIERLLSEPDLLNRLRDGIQPTRTIDAEMQDIVTQYDLLLNPALSSE